MQYRVDSNLSNEIYALGQVNDKLREALDGITDVIRTLQSDVWQGDSKEAALSLLSIFHTYHIKILEASDMNLCAMNVLDEKASSYMNGGAIPMLWSSDSPSQSFGEKVSSSINETSNYLYNEANKAGDYVSEKTNEAGEYVSEKANEAGEYVSGKANEAGEYVTKKATEVGEYASDKMNQAGENISEVANQAGESISEASQNASKFISNIL